ncbi:hypothetical protein [Sediminicoccus rosea]|uniref:Tyr recombinase domain-containing protein n=1 Tax=Sediminicoccus rosea TaxID=1225128 RepID=A0ABZ0PJX4_9PROT|nr:hypothetical protein [Sediminicoccus rosea]WPB85959.1 hypothetical protein R9Z33_03610 [Sediminicoccus rosea]
MNRMAGRKPAAWPEADRAAWELANTVSYDVWDDAGKALRLRPWTRKGYARAYGIWLAWLDRSGQLDPAEGPGQRPSPERIAGWVRTMRDMGRKNGVIKLYLMSLHAILAFLAPGTDTSFILRPGGRSLDELFPTEPKPFTPHDSGDLLEHAKALHARGLTDRDGDQRWKALRDAAIMAMLYVYGPRHADISSMVMGENLRMTRNGQMIARFRETATKDKRWREYPLHPVVAAIVRDYLELARPHLCGPAEEDWLWWGKVGEPLTYRGFEGVVRRRNRDFTGVAEGPQMARKWLTETAKNRSPEAAFDAAEVAGHTPRVALRYYAQAVDYHSGGRHGAYISELREQLGELADRAYAERRQRRGGG